jgi:hypothetical protein
MTHVLCIGTLQAYLPALDKEESLCRVDSCRSGNLWAKFQTSLLQRVGTIPVSESDEK